MDPIRVSTYVIGILMHAAGLGLNAECLREVVRTKKRHTWLFWWCSGLSIACFAAASGIEITFFVVSLLSLFRWASLHTMSGDIAVRLGIILLVAIRFARLSLILDPPKRKLLIPFLLLVLIPMITSLALGIDFRLKESAYFQSSPTAIGRPLWLDNIRKQESLVAFISAFLAMSVNIGTDVVFFTIIKSRLHLQKAQLGKGRAGVAAYAMAIVAKVVYLALMTWAQVITGGPLNLPVRSMAITLSRFSPTVETYVFFTRTIPTSRNLLQSRKLATSSEAMDQTINQTILVTTTMGTSESPPSQLGDPLNDMRPNVSAMASSTSAAEAPSSMARMLDRPPATVHSRDKLCLEPNES